MNLLSKQTDSQTLRMNFWLPGGRWEKATVRDGHLHTAVFKMDNQQ